MNTKGLDKETRQRLKRRVRFSIVDETRMERLASVRMGWWRFIAFLAAAIVVLGFIGVMLIVTTPLKAILPGYLYSYERDDVMTAAIKMDSLNEEVAVRNAYVDNLMAILQNDVDTVSPVVGDSVPAIIPIDSIITASEIERDFVQQYEAGQKYNISVLTPLTAQGMTFINPLQGAQVKEPRDGDDERHLTFELPSLQPVSAVYRGTVLDVYNTLEGGFTVIVQHPNDFISRYSGLSDVAVKRGQTVAPGQRLGIIERAKADRWGFQPAFELWFNGTPVAPRDYLPL